MPRTRRIIPESGPLHIMCRGNNKNRILRSSYDKRSYLELLSRYKSDRRIIINHYCIMDNHVHLIVWIDKNSDLPKYMKQVNLSYFHVIRKKYDYCGHLWQGRFKSSIIDSESYLLQCGKYIELNPVRAGLAKAPDQYMFSSYRYYSDGITDSLLRPSPLYLELAPSATERMILYRKLVVEHDLRHKLRSKFIGDSEYASKMQNRHSVSNVPRPVGRPRQR